VLHEVAGIFKIDSELSSFGFESFSKFLLSLSCVHATNLAIVPHGFLLAQDLVSVRIARIKDSKRLEQLILGNREWLRPWEATNPEGPNSFDVRRQLRGLLRQMDEQISLPFVVEFDGEVVGQLNVANILYGSVSSAVIGYWIAPEVAGRGVMTTAVGLVCDYLFNVVGLHRIEIAIRPENSASLRIVEKLGFRFEGLRERFIHINGAWRNHYVFALTHEEVPEGVLKRMLNGAVPAQHYPWRQNSIEIKHTELNSDIRGS
jgi:ribosomal-protein-alanine N-acetyltransferase